VPSILLTPPTPAIVWSSRRCTARLPASPGQLPFSTADVRRESDGRTYRALVRFRAVTEPE